MPAPKSLFSICSSLVFTLPLQTAILPVSLAPSPLPLWILEGPQSHSVPRLPSLSQAVLAARVDLVGDVPGTDDKVLTDAPLRGSHVPRDSLGKKGSYKAHHRHHSSSVRSTLGWALSLLTPLQPFGSSYCFCENFLSRQEKGAAKAAASGFPKTWTERRYNRLRASQTLPQATRESLISMV